MKEILQFQICVSCKIKKDINSFYIAAINKSGRQGECKVCSAKRSKAYYNRPGGKKKRGEYNRRRLLDPVLRAARAKYYKERAKDPIFAEKIRAYRKEYDKRPEVMERDRKSAKKYNSKPEVKERRRIYMKVYMRKYYLSKKYGPDTKD